MFFPSLSDSAQGGHEDIVRCVEVDSGNGALWSGGEDGKVVAWNVRDAQDQSTPGVGSSSETMIASPLDSARVGGAGTSRRTGVTPTGNRFKPYG